MKEITSDPKLVAYCGLYCGACKRYLKEKCPGCHKNEKASWCKIRACCVEHNYESCADCTEFTSPNDCKKFNNLMAKMFGFIFNSNRVACIEQISEMGIEKHAEKMTELKTPSIKKR